MDRLIKKYLEGNTTPAENRVVFEWVRRSEENRLYFKSLRQLHDITIWRSDLLLDHQQPKRLHKPIPSLFVRVAAIALLLVGLFLIYKNVAENNIFLRLNGGSDHIVEIKVPTGKNIKLELEDGTKVWLNSKSVFSYPPHFNDQSRVVRLSGEGYFDVAHDQKRSFRVETSKYAIEVLGTEFNIRAYEHTDLFETSLLQGSVKIQSLYAADQMILKPNERVIAKEDRMDITSFNKDEFLWKEGILSIHDKTIQEISIILEQYFDSRFILEESVQAHPKKYTGKFRIEDGVEHILKILQVDNEIAYEFNTNNNVITIKKK